MNTLKAAFKALEIKYDDRLIKLFEDHMKLVLEWNKKVNLTGITEKEEFIEKHYIDSLVCVGTKQLAVAREIVDIGTGAGFPGVPLAMIYPDKNFVLIDSSMKKLKIVEDIGKTLGIKNISVVHGRAEDLANDKIYREKFDFCVSRAVAELSILAEYCLPFIKIDGTLAAYKTKMAEAEIDGALRAIEILGGEIEERKHIEIEEFQLNHLILMIRKLNKSPANYPRKAGIPKKQPLK